MGRTSFKVHKDLIRSLRERHHLTQAQVAERIDVHLTRYQNIEWKGTTSPKTAQKLADLFGVSTDDLQRGIELPDSGDYIRQIEHIVRKQLANGENATLNEAIQRICAETLCLSGAGKVSREEAAGYLAEDIAQRIEAVQLVRNKNEIVALGKLTGLSEEELLRQANAEGIWFVNIHHRSKNESESFNAHSEVRQRANFAIGIIKDHLKEHQMPENLRGSDETVRLTQDGFWYRIEIRNPYVKRTIRIDLVRCRSETKGLLWVKPSERDEYLIRDPLRDWARENFNFVTDFDGKQSPSGDIRQLRILLTAYNQNSQGFPRPTGGMLLAGRLGDMGDDLLASVREQSKAHFLVQNWLTDDLKCVLAPLLADYPIECWSMNGLSIDLNENRSKDRKRPFPDCYLGTKYSIELVEQLGEGKYEPVPWRNEDKKALEKSIQEMLGNPEDPAWSTDEPRRKFEPYCAES
jgi:transcriptional regulator with XRE-family HTH domain